MSDTSKKSNGNVDSLNTLSIHLFGTPRLFSPKSTCPIALTPSALRLLAYLLLKGKKAHSRNVVIGDLWGEMEESKARSCLSTALWRLRDAIEPSNSLRGEYLIGIHRNEIGFNWNGDFRLDTFRFEEGVSRGLSIPPIKCDESTIEEMDEALSLYTGDLLEGYFDEWIMKEREWFLGLFLRGLQHRFQWSLAKGLPDEAIACGCAILARDPYREDIRRELEHMKEKLGYPLLSHGDSRKKDPYGRISSLDIRDLFDVLNRNCGTGPHASERSRLGNVLLEDLRTATKHISEAISGIEVAQDRLSRLLLLFEAHIPTPPGPKKTGKSPEDLSKCRIRVRKR